MLDTEKVDVRRASEVLYEELVNSRNGPRRDNIRLIKQSCDQMEKDKVPMTAAEIVRRCGETGPAYSTVSNKGSPLGEYIRLRIIEQGALKTTSDLKKSLADSVADPVLQAQIRDKEQTAKWVSRENQGLRKLLKNLSPGVDIDAMLEGANTAAKGPTTTLQIEKRPLDPEVGAALLKLFAHLVGRGYSELRGRFAINSKVVLDATEYTALKRATGLSDDDWNTRYGGGEAKAG